MFVFIGVALGSVLTLLSGLGRSRATMWLALAARLVLFVTIVAWLSRSFGPVAGLAVLVAAVVTRGVLSKKRVHPAR